VAAAPGARRSTTVTDGPVSVMARSGILLPPQLARCSTAVRQAPAMGSDYAVAHSLHERGAL
jgi:hypothetical protein